MATSQRETAWPIVAGGGEGLAVGEKTPGSDDGVPVVIVPEDANQRAGGGIPEPDRSILRAGGEGLAVRAENDRHRGCAWSGVAGAGLDSPGPADLLSQGARRARPVATSQIRTVGSPPPAEARVLPSGLKAISPDSSGVVVLERTDQRAGGDVPELDRPVPAGGGEESCRRGKYASSRISFVCARRRCGWAGRWRRPRG